MSRRFDEVGERGRRDVDAAKSALKRLGDGERVLLRAWLCIYFDDSGALFSPQLSRRCRRIVLDEVEYLLVKMPKRTNS